MNWIVLFSDGSHQHNVNGFYSPKRYRKSISPPDVSQFKMAPAAAAGYDVIGTFDLFRLQYGPFPFPLPFGAPRPTPTLWRKNRRVIDYVTSSFDLDLGREFSEYVMARRRARPEIVGTM